MKNFAPLLSLAVAAALFGCSSEPVQPLAYQTIPGGGYTYGTDRDYTPAPVTAPLPLMTVDPAAQVPAGSTVITAMPGGVAPLPGDPLASAEAPPVAQVEPPAEVNADSQPVTRIVAPDSDIPTVQPDIAYTPQTTAAQEVMPQYVPQYIYPEPQVIYYEPTPTYVPVYVYSQPQIIIEREYVPLFSVFFDPFCFFAPRPYYDHDDHDRDRDDHFRRPERPVYTYHAPLPPPPPAALPLPRPQSVTLPLPPAPLPLLTAAEKPAPRPIAPVASLTPRTAPIASSVTNPRRPEAPTIQTAKPAPAPSAPLLVTTPSTPSTPVRTTPAIARTPRADQLEIVPPPAPKAGAPITPTNLRPTNPTVVAAPKKESQLPVIEKAPARTSAPVVIKDTPPELKPDTPRSTPRPRSDVVLDTPPAIDRTPARTFTPAPAPRASSSGTFSASPAPAAPEIRSSPRASVPTFAPAAPSTPAPARSAAPSVSSGSKSNGSSDAPSGGGRSGGGSGRGRQN
jgi:hypothetical protein